MHVQEMKSEIRNTCDKYLDLNFLRTDNGSFVSEMPSWFSPSLIGKIVNDYKSVITKICTCNDILTALTSKIERLTWIQGAKGMADNIHDFIKEAGYISKSYADIPVAFVNEEELHLKYEQACRVTLKEKITKSNSDDILSFRDVLIIQAGNACESALYGYISKLYHDIATSAELSALIERFDELYKTASNLIDIRNSAIRNAVWDKEFSRLFPIDFFKRNIEEIDETTAFQLFFLQHLARHEDDLKNSGFLTDSGELSIFTNRELENIELLDTLFLF